jgi:hypothetical protein
MDIKRQVGLSRRAIARLSATDDLGFRKDLAQVRHATTNSAAKIEDRTDGASQLLHSSIL